MSEVQTKSCAVIDCDDGPFGHGLCNKHYLRNRKHGTTDPQPTWNKALSPFERIMERSVAGLNGCVVWTGTGTTNGYGQIKNPTGGSRLVHRISYEHYKGEIPEGLHIDHLCRNTRCVNPLHLEAVTQAENNRRKVARKSGTK